MRIAARFVAMSLLASCSFAFGQAETQPIRSFVDPPAKIATAQEIADMYAAKEYRISVQQISRVFLLSGAAAKPFDRYSLLMLKGQGRMQLKDPPSARWACEDALKVAPSASTAAVARARSALIQASIGNVYRSRTNIRAESISIVEPDSFQKAMQSYFDDEMAAANSEVGPTWTPLIERSQKILQSAQIVLDRE